MCCRFNYLSSGPPWKVFVVIALTMLSLLLLATVTILVLIFVWRVADLMREYVLMFVLLLSSLVVGLVWWALMLDTGLGEQSGTVLWFLIELAQIIVCMLVALLSLKWLFAFVFLLRGEPWSPKTEKTVPASLFLLIGAFGVVGFACFVWIAVIAR